MPNGSPLGPILFIIFVKDLLCFLTNCKIIQYADDTQFIYTSNLDDVNDLMHKIEQPVKLVKKIIFHKNGLMLKAKKKMMFIGSRGSCQRFHPTLTCRWTAGASLKGLGVHFDNRLLFDTHITEISKKVYGTLMYSSSSSSNSRNSSSSSSSNNSRRSRNSIRSSGEIV